MKNLYKYLSLILLILSASAIVLISYQIIPFANNDAKFLIGNLLALLSIPQFIILIAILKNGTFIENKSKVRFRFYVISAIIFIIGVMFKILHLPSALNIILCGILIFVTTYFIHFLLKQQKTILDILKFLWIITAFLGFSFLVFHLPGRYIFKLIPQFIFWLMALAFGLQQYKKYTNKQKQLIQK